MYFIHPPVPAQVDVTLLINKRKKTMNKQDFVLKVQNPPEDWDLECEIEVSAWDGDRMIDEHITEAFPELDELSLYDLAEGTMEYGGTLTKEQLAEELRGLGFTVELI